MLFRVLAALTCLASFTVDLHADDTGPEVRARLKILAAPDAEAEGTEAAFKAVIRIGSPAIPTLLDALRMGETFAIREQAARLLYATLEAHPRLVLDSGQVLEVAQAVRQAGIGWIPALTGTLELCHSRGADLRRALPDLVAGTKSQDGCFRVLCLATLVRVDAKNRDQYVAALVDHMLKHAPGDQHQGTARRALRQLGPLAKAALPSLKPELQAAGPRRRLDVTSVLYAIDPENWATYLDVVTQALRDPDADTRLWAVVQAGNFDHLPQEGRRTLRQALEAVAIDQDEVLRRAVERALKSIETQEKTKPD